MANRRMFSKTITNSSRFLMMPQTTQSLYFHLGMNADDDGFVEHFAVMRMVEAKPDDLKVLQAREFVKVFDDKVLVVLDWKENNFIRNDRYTPSKYLKAYKEELALLGGRTTGIPEVYQRDTEIRIGEEETATPILVVKDELKPKTEKHTVAVYNKLLKWAENERGFKFMTGSITKQYAALKEANKNGLKPFELQARWEEMATEPFWEAKGFDWMDVVKSFNKRPA